MMLLMLFLLISSKAYLEVEFVEKGILLDGKIDSVWQICDSIIVDKQFYPYYDSVSTYKTIIKAIQDRRNIYFLVKINYKKDKPRTALSGRNDEVVIYLDPLLSKVNAYFFEISPDGSRFDGIITQDGRGWDPSWDGVWENRINVFKNKKGEYIFVSEIKIPFKTINFSKDKKEWGFQVKTEFYKNKEESYFILPDQEEDLRVSKFGILKNVKPGAGGYGIEFYPVSLLKNDYYYARDENLKGKTFPWVGFDIFYRKENHTLNMAILPDFAEIESDPYTMSFSKYEIFYSERRPFFLEGKNIFEPSGFGRPVKTFYSRRIGRRMYDGTGEVPILSGLKYTYKSNRYETGILSALTGRKNGDWDTSYQTLWNVIRLKRYYFLNSETGVLITHKKNLEKNEYYSGGDIDGALRWNKNQIAYQVVSSFKDKEKAGFLFNTGVQIFLTDKIMFISSAEYVNDYLDISEMGYQTFYPGDKSLSGALSYQNFPKKGRVSSYSFWGGTFYGKEGYEKEPSVGGNAGMSINLRNPQVWGNMNIGYVKAYEMDTSFFGKWLNLNFGLRLTQFFLWSGCFVSYDWNYNRNFLAWTGSIWGGFSFPIGSRVHLSSQINGWMEFDTTGNYLSTTLSKNIYLTYHITPFMHITLYLNPVSLIEKEKTHLSHARASFYYSWEVKPKSKIYIIYNHSFINNGDTYTTEERISAIKIRWIFLF